jgi:hypothetical protein
MLTTTYALYDSVSSGFTSLLSQNNVHDTQNEMRSHHSHSLLSTIIWSPSSLRSVVVLFWTWWYFICLTITICQENIDDERSSACKRHETYFSIHTPTLTDGCGTWISCNACFVPTMKASWARDYRVKQDSVLLLWWLARRTSQIMPIRERITMIPGKPFSYTECTIIARPSDILQNSCRFFFAGIPKIERYPPKNDS